MTEQVNNLTPTYHAIQTYSLTTDNKKEVLLSQRGRTMLRVCQSLVSFNSTKRQEHSLLLLVT